MPFHFTLEEIPLPENLYLRQFYNINYSSTDYTRVNGKFISMRWGTPAPQEVVDELTRREKKPGDQYGAHCEFMVHNSHIFRMTRDVDEPGDSDYLHEFNEDKSEAIRREYDQALTELKSRLLDKEFESMYDLIGEMMKCPNWCYRFDVKKDCILVQKLEDVGHYGRVLFDLGVLRIVS